MSNAASLRPLDLRGLWSSAAKELVGKSEATGINAMLELLAAKHPSITGLIDHAEKSQESRFPADLFFLGSEIGC